MKIGLLTFHNALNYGACLQAYATQQVLDTLGFDCECLDYENRARRDAYRMTRQMVLAVRAGQWKSAMRHAVGLPFLELRRLRFTRFHRLHMRLSPGKARNSAQAKAVAGRYDAFVVGSDQVWNPAHNGGDSAYLLDFVSSGKRKVSYASSFGIMDLSPNMRGVYAKHLQGFDAISVRERQGATLVRALTGRTVPVVLDPVLLLTKAEWLSRLPTHKRQRPVRPGYFFLYLNRPGQRTRFLAMLPPALRKTQLHLLTRYLRPKDFVSRTTKVVYALSPEEFLREIADARFVMTASFHGAALAIVFEKPFAVMLTGDAGKDARLHTLLETLALTGRIVIDNTSWADLEAPIDYEDVRRRLEAERQASFRFLTNALYEYEGMAQERNGG